MDDVQPGLVLGGIVQDVLPAGPRLLHHRSDLGGKLQEVRAIQRDEQLGQLSRGRSSYLSPPLDPTTCSGGMTTSSSIRVHAALAGALRAFMGLGI